MHQDCDKSEHIGKLYEQLHNIDKRVTVVEDTLTELTEIKTDVHSIKQLLEQGRGVFKTIQFFVWILGPLAAFFYWWKEHVY